MFGLGSIQTKIIIMVNAQEWLDESYPKEERKNIKKLDVSKKGLEGELSFLGFTNLKKLFC